MFYHRQKIKYRPYGDSSLPQVEAEILGGVHDDGIHYLLKFADSTNTPGWCWTVRDIRTTNPEVRKLIQLAKLSTKEIKDSWFLWIEQSEFLASITPTRTPFRAKKKGERIRNYRLVKKIWELEQDFKERQYAKANNLPLLPILNFCEEDCSEPEYQESEEYAIAV